MTTPTNNKTTLPEASHTSEYVRLHTFEGGRMQAPAKMLIDGLIGVVECGSWRNLIIHEPSGIKLWFDLGLSDNLANYPPFIRNNQIKLFQAQPAITNIGDDARSVGVDPSSVKYIFASHAHWDHIYPVGSIFPNAKFVCGPGSLEVSSRSWPTHPDSTFDGRIWDTHASELPIEELPSTEEATAKWQPIGPFSHGLDFFGDGSFWLINAPGHFPGNLAGLARTKNRDGERRWILLGGDCLHCYHLLHYPEAPFGTGLTITGSGTLHEDGELARQVIRNIAALKTAYNDELFVWPSHVDSLEGIWEFETGSAVNSE